MIKQDTFEFNIRHTRERNSKNIAIFLLNQNTYKN